MPLPVSYFAKKDDELSSKGKFCCFRCPKPDFGIKAIDELCPDCGRPYNFELKNPPERIGEYKIIRALGRGFYGATFVAERVGPIPRNYVLKVVPKNNYIEFGKDFSEECQTHASAASGADFIVDIIDAFDGQAVFGDCDLEVHVAVLEYLDGKPLQSYLDGKTRISAGLVAQIACDLVKVVHELRARSQNHNDFHAGNILVEELTRERYRDAALEPSIRAVAIDLGSTSGDRRSGGGYKSDLHWVAEHIEILSSKLLQNVDGQVDDLDARVALALKDVAASISAPVETQRTPPAEEMVRAIEQAYYRSGEPWRPWRSPLVFKNFGESYNAQTLAPWHIPQLLVDPEGDWQRRASSKGPLIVTGMRGCGKTMLLRSLQFHARAMQKRDETEEQVIARLTSDGFVGLFVSAQILVDRGTSVETPNNKLFARLLLAYALEASRALAHLKDIKVELVSEQSSKLISNVLSDLLTGFQIEAPGNSIERFEHTLVRKLLEVSKPDNSCTLDIHPSKSFPALAKAIAQCSKIWADSRILFLLDDVSTRYLQPEKIEEIFSAIIFQNTDQGADCAFKLTSETQTIFLSLKSLGGVEYAAHWRDFETFDLGAEVYSRLKGKGGKAFIGKILSQRSQYFPSHPKVHPTVVLGDKKLNELAHEIVVNSAASGRRKSVYAGISALKAVCVGDIGSVISIYESILHKGQAAHPVSADVQSQVFQDHCARHLYVLDRRGSDLKNTAKSFAEASYRALINSHRKGETRGLRQYTSIYVNASAEEAGTQNERLRELVDAGVFVFHGGTPRSKTEHSDPVQQFKLVFRKLYGLADFIPLADRDRFELTGKDLSEWLSNPQKGPDLLNRNLGAEIDDEYETDEGETSIIEPRTSETDQPEFDLAVPTIQSQAATKKHYLDVPKIYELSDKEVDKLQIDEILLGLGFEESCEKSASNCFERLKPKTAKLIEYNLSGRADAIRKTVLGCLSDVEVRKADARSFFEKGADQTCRLIDISGLAKPIIYRSVKAALQLEGFVYLAFTEPEVTSPKDEDLAKILDAQEQQESVVDSLRQIVGSEFPPYHSVEVDSMESDATRSRALLAFSSSSHERLVHLVSENNYNHADLVTSTANSSHAKIAAMLAKAAAREAESSEILEVDLMNPQHILKTVEQSYTQKYRDSGMNFEIGLTGGKLDTVASAAFCSRYPVNKVWYVRPNKFDPDKFSQGAKATRYFKISEK